MTSDDSNLSLRIIYNASGVQQPRWFTECTNSAWAGTA